MAIALGNLSMLNLAMFRTGTATTALSASTTLVATVFKAHKTANITRARFNVTAVAGTGGTVRARICAVDGSGNADTGTVYATESAATGTTGDKTITFATPYSVTANTDYALVLDNTDGTPGTNYPTLSTYTGHNAYANSFPYFESYVPSTWTKRTGTPCMGPGYSDELVAGVAMMSEGNSFTFKQDNATADEYANAFTVDSSRTCVGCDLALEIDANTTDFEVVFYEGASTLHTVAFDATNISSITGVRSYRLKWPSAVLCASGNTYRIAVRPSQTTSSVILAYMLYQSTAARDEDLGLTMYCSRRKDAGAWTDFNSGADVRVVSIAPILTSVESAASGGLLMPNLRGNFA